MPLTPKGETIKSAMTEHYGAEKGEEVFYASANKGTITGVDEMDAETKHDPHTGQFTGGSGGGAGKSQVHHEVAMQRHTAAAKKAEGRGDHPAAEMHQAAAQAHLKAHQSTTSSPARYAEAAKAAQEATKMAGKPAGIPWKQERGDGVDEMENKPEEDCGDNGMMQPMPSTPDAFGGIVDQTGLVTQPLPVPEFEHPQLHPDASTPPEPALDGLGGRDAAAGYGGVAGGVIPQGFDKLGDALPTGMSLNDACRGSEQFWGPQWKGTE